MSEKKLKLKFPKTIMVGSVEFLIETNNKRTDGEFFYWDKDRKTKKMKKGKIIIGTELLNVNPVSVLEVIIHELKEIIQAEQRVRFTRPDTKGEYEFHYNHRHHTDLCGRLAGLLSKFLV